MGDRICEVPLYSLKREKSHFFCVFSALFPSSILGMYPPNCNIARLAFNLMLSTPKSLQSSSFLFPIATLSSRLLSLTNIINILLHTATRVWGWYCRSSISVHSTFNELMSLIISSATDINNHAIRVFIDLSRTVVAVDHGIHVNNLDCISVRRLGNDLIKNHSENRMQLSMKAMVALRELPGITT